MGQHDWGVTKWLNNQNISSWRKVILLLPLFYSRVRKMLSTLKMLSKYFLLEIMGKWVGRPQRLNLKVPWAHKGGSIQAYLWWTACVHFASHDGSGISWSQRKLWLPIRLKYLQESETGLAEMENVTAKTEESVWVNHSSSLAVLPIKGAREWQQSRWISDAS